MLNIIFFISSFFFLTFSTSNAQQIRYLNGLYENESCELRPNFYGTCRKILDCPSEFQSYRQNKSVLKVCGFRRNMRNDLICCPPAQMDSAVSRMFWNAPKRNRFSTQRNVAQDLIDFNFCRQKHLKYREMTINPDHLSLAIVRGVIPDNRQIRQYIEQLRAVEKSELLQYFRPIQAAYHGTLAKRGSRPNMAAIGWTQSDNSIAYKCGGSLISERFIVTAAHCKFFNWKQPDTVRLGDRYLLTREDDEIAQQHKIEKFILHPEYNSTFHYNDIAMIKTATRIIYNAFVVPSCIYDQNAEQVGKYSEWSVAGYGQTEDGLPSNILLELKAVFVDYEECNRIYEDNHFLPNGILPSQFCVKSDPVGINYPDTCFGDSGSPLQFDVINEVLHDDFNKTLLSTVYKTPATLGVVSFGVDCGRNYPSVYTKLSYFQDWMRNVMRNH